MKIRSLLLALLLVACSPPPAPSRLIDVYATPATRPWLTDLYTCAAQIGLTPRFDPQTPDISLWLGEILPAGTTFAYEIGREDLVIAAHPASPLTSLTLEQARQLFAGRGDPAIQIWVYPPATDLQQTVDAVLMNDRPITSLARLAFDPQHMAEALSSDPNRVGILPRRALSSLRELLAIPSAPILATTPSSPQPDLLPLLTCLQNKPHPTTSPNRPTNQLPNKHTSD